MKSIRRIVSMVLCFVMVLGMLPMSVLAAETTASEPVYVLAGGDFQQAGDHSNSAENVANILSAIVDEGYTAMDGFLFIGDYDCETHNDATETANGITSLMNTVQGVYSGINYDNAVLVQGNHDYMDSRIDATGGHDFDAYSVFVLNEDDYVNGGGSQSGVQALAAEMEQWLNEKLADGYAKPIFVTSHLPLAFGPRTNTQGDGKYAKYLFDVLNAAGENGLNIIFLHGHDHAYGYDNYLGGEAIYLEKGDMINIANVGSQSAYTSYELNFTYMNAGYTGYYNESGYTTDAGTDMLTMTVFTITDDEVTVGRYSANGEYNLKSAGRLTGDYINKVSVTANTDVYKTTQTVALTEPAGQISVTKNGVTVSAVGLANLEVETVEDIPALNDTSKYEAYTGYDMTCDFVGIATVSLPVPEDYPVDNVKVYYVNGTALTDMEAEITGSGANRVATFTTTHNSVYVVVNESASSATDWVGVGATANSGYRYVLDTDGVEFGSNHKYIVVGSNDNYALTVSGTGTGRTSVNVSNNTITLNNRPNYEFYFADNSGSESGSYLLTQNGTDTVYHSGGTLYYRADNKGYWHIGTNSNGAYQLYDTDGSSWYLNYGYVWENQSVDRFSVSSTARTVRLFKYTPDYTHYARLLGNSGYAVHYGTSAEDALALVKESVDVQYYTAGNSGNIVTPDDNWADWKFADNYSGTTSGSYTVEVSYAGTVIGTVEVYVLSGTADWVLVEAGAGSGYKYVLDENGIDAGTKYLIVNTSNNGRAYVLTNNGNGGVTRTECTISNKEIIVSDDTDINWIFSNSTSGTVGNQGDYIYLARNGDLSLNDDGETTTFSNQRNGAYRIYRRPSNNSDYYYLRYYNNAWTKSSTANTSSISSVYLFAYDGPVTGNPGTLGKMEGQTLYQYTVGESTAVQAMNAVKNNITVYTKSEDADDSTKVEVDDNDVDFEWAETYDPNTPGYYTVNVSYNDVKLGTATVQVIKKYVKAFTLSEETGYVAQYAAADTVVRNADGDPITIKIDYMDGTSSTTYLTVSMIQNAKTSEYGTKTGLDVQYKGYDLYDNFTLHVAERVLSDDPEYPDEGAVKVSKTATGIDFQSTGVAKVELSASGVPAKKGIDVIVMVDTSSSMKSWCIECNAKFDTDDCDHDNQQNTYSRASVFEESLEDLIAQFQKPGDDGETQDIRVAIADFNGFDGYNNTTNYGTPYDRDETDTTNDDDWYSATNQAIVYTGVNAGERDLTASAFVHASQLPTDSAEFGFNYVSGTNYDYAFDAIYQLGYNIQKQNAQNGEERDLYVIFMSDGAPMQYNYYHSQGNSTRWQHWLTGTVETNGGFGTVVKCQEHTYYYDESNRNQHRMANAVKGDISTRYEVIRKSTAGMTDEGLLEETGEQNMYTLPGLGATMFSIAFDPVADGNTPASAMTHVLENIASEQTGSTPYYYLADSANDLSNAFISIGSAIAYAASNARYVDEMGTAFDLQLKSTVTRSDGTVIPIPETPIIEVKTYDIYTRQDWLDGDCTEEQVGDRKGTHTVLERISFSEDGTAAYSLYDTDGDGSLEDEALSGNILSNGVICANTFWYNTNVTDTLVDTDGDGTMDDYLDTDGDGAVDDRLGSETFYWKLGTIKTSELAISYYVYLTGSMEGTREAGSYTTNESAILYYDNYLGNPMQKPTVSPVMAWKAANVSYAFYLVNEQGQIITNQSTGQTGPFSQKVPVTNPVVYDEILLNNTDNVRAISVTDVANTILPDGYELFDTEAEYTIHIFSESTDSRWQITKGTDVATTYVTGFGGTPDYSNALSEDSDGYEYTHTTVWFAVVWKIQALPDSVVVDYGLPVDISVLTNDMFGDYGALAAVGPYSEGIETAPVSSTLADRFGESYTDSNAYGTAAVNGNKVRYTLNKSNGMQMQTYDKFAYAVNYTGTANAGYYYDTVTVIPATTVYYEDDFLTYTYTGPEGSTGWTDEGTAIEGAVQDEDRPGQYSLTDANNIYGYDAVNLPMSAYSLGTAKKVTVDKDSYAQAQFTFWGTGFDLVSMTSSDTGVLVVQVYDADTNALVTSKFVDTYYGVRYNGETGKWETVVDGVADTPNEIYQVPVIEFANLKNGYDKYKVVITASYYDTFNNLDDGSYDLYIDAVRIYDPANDGAADSDNVIENAYAADGESWPEYFELRNLIIEAEALGAIKDPSTGAVVIDPALESSTVIVPGLMFIDGDASVNDAQISDYTSYGPNNEVYLAPNQRVAFLLDLSQYVDASGKSIVDNVHIGIRSADDTPASYTFTNVAQSDKIVDNQTITAGTYYNAKTETISSTTDMYYDLSDWKDDIIVISNYTADTRTTGCIAITNIKVTFTQNPNGTDTAGGNDSDLSTASADSGSFLYMTPSAATLTLRSLNAASVDQDIPEVEETPGETEPTEPETEPTEPETEPTEPETEPTEPETEPTEPETEPTEPENKPSTGGSTIGGIIGKVIGRIIGKLIGWLRG